MAEKQMMQQKKKTSENGDAGRQQNTQVQTIA